MERGSDGGREEGKEMGKEGRRKMGEAYEEEPQEVLI